MTSWYRYWVRGDAERGPSRGRAPAAEGGAELDGRGQRASTFHVEPASATPPTTQRRDPIAAGADASPAPGAHGPAACGAGAAGTGPVAGSAPGPEQALPSEAELPDVAAPDGTAAHRTAPSFHVEPGPATTSGGGRTTDATVPAPPRTRRYRTAQVQVVANQKGGVGKTTTAVSVAAALADAGCATLLVDLDPQGNATSGVGQRVSGDDLTIYDVLVDEVALREVVLPTAVPGLSLVPANIELAGAEIELVTAFSREQKLRRALDDVRDDFDVILVDCPPSLGLLTVNALTAGDGVLVPIQCEYYALEGLGALQRNAELVRRNLNPTMRVTGYIMTMLDARTRLAQQVVDEVRAHFGDLVFRTAIPRSVRLAEAPSYGQPITQFDPSSRGARAYRRLAKELLARLDAAAVAAGGAA